MFGQSKEIRLLRTLGAGGFGAVYLVEISRADGFTQTAALKVLHANMSAHADIAGRQRDEARLLAALNHDHIVRVLDMGTYDGRPAVLMEYVEGVDADQLHRLGPMPVRAALEIVAAIAAALNAASNTVNPRTGRPLAVVHRDIKPANALVTPTGLVKVLDFGIARADIDREGDTRSAQYGTARYMAPEIWLDGRVTSAVDIYALGVTLLELLRGEHFERPALLRALFETAVREAIDAAIPNRADPFSTELRALLASMMAYDDRDRPNAASVFEAATDLAETAPGERLSRFARRVVPALSRAPRDLPPPPAPRDPASDTMSMDALASDSVPPAEISEPQSPASPTLASTSSGATNPTPVARRRPLWGAWAAVALMLGVVGVWALRGSEVQPVEPAAPVAPAEDAALKSTVDPAPDAALKQAAPESAPEIPAEGPSQVAPAAAPTQRGASSNHAQAAPAPPPIEAPPAPEAPAPASPALSCTSDASAVSIDVASDPMGATVELNGARLGTTPLRGCGLPPGAYTLSLSLGAAHAERTLRVSRRGPTRYLWRQEGDVWEVE